MKLSLLFLSYFNAELITPNNEKYCYGTGVSLGDHNYMGRPKYTNDVDGCSQQCSRDRRCNFFTYESSQKDKCLGCFRVGWDYGDVTDIFDASHYGIEGSGSVFKCAEICFYAQYCRSVSYDKSKDICMLFNQPPKYVNPTYTQFQSADQLCTDQSCITNGYPVILPTSKMRNLIQYRTKHSIKVRNELNCKDICVIINSCNYFTFNKKTRECYLHKDPSFLRYDARVVGGEADCRNTDDFEFEDYPAEATTVPR